LLAKPYQQNLLHKPARAEDSKEWKVKSLL